MVFSICPTCWSDYIFSPTGLSHSALRVEVDRKFSFQAHSQDLANTCIWPSLHLSQQCCVFLFQEGFGWLQTLGHKTKLKKRKRQTIDSSNTGREKDQGSLG